MSEQFEDSLALTVGPHKRSQIMEFDIQARPAGNSSLNRLMQLHSRDSEDGGRLDATGWLEKDLEDFFDIQIFSTVYFGSQKEPHELIFDTGSSWLWV